MVRAWVAMVLAGAVLLAMAAPAARAESLVLRHVECTRLAQLPALKLVIRTSEVLAKLGGLEIAGITGLIIGAAFNRIPVVIDGFIAGAAALVAVSLKPDIREYLFAGHRSAEAGHRVILEWLQLMPLLDLSMRLGEGTGAALGMFIIESGIRILREMLTFEEAGVKKAVH